MMNNKYVPPAILYNFCLWYLAIHAQVWAQWDLWGHWDIWKLQFARSTQLAGVTTGIRRQTSSHSARLALFIHNIQSASRPAVPRTYPEHKSS